MEKPKKVPAAGGIGLALLGTAALAGIAAAVLASDDPDKPEKE